MTATKSLYLKIEVDEELSAEWRVPLTTTLSFVDKHLVLKVSTVKIQDSIETTLDTCNIKVTRFKDKAEIWFPVFSVKSVILKDSATITQELVDD